MSLEVLKLIFGDARAAVASGTFGIHEGHCEVRFWAEVDQQGWDELARIHREAYEDVRAAIARSAERLAEGGETSLPVTSANLLFESPVWPQPLSGVRLTSPAAFPAGREPTDGMPVGDSTWPLSFAAKFLQFYVHCARGAAGPSLSACRRFGFIATISRPPPWFEVVRERGYELATLADFAARSGTSREQLERRFEDKADAVLKVLDGLLASFRAEVQVAFDGEESWPDNLRAAARAAERWMRRNPGGAHFVLVGVLEAPELVRVRREEAILWGASLIDAGREEAPDPGAVPRSAPLIAIGSIVETLRRAYEGSAEHRALATVPELMCAAVRPYLGAEAARRELERAAEEATNGSDRLRPVAKPRGSDAASLPGSSRARAELGRIVSWCRAPRSGRGCILASWSSCRPI